MIHFIYHRVMVHILAVNYTTAAKTTTTTDKQSRHKFKELKKFDLWCKVV